jgi:sugar/nucleoside kinase (ribokinase family)
MAYDVICVGSALLDIYMKSSAFKAIPSGDFSGGVALCEEFGGKTEIADMEVTTGGGGTNNAVSFARKGFKTALIAELGQDLISRTIVTELKEEKVSCELLVLEKEEETGMSVMLVDETGGRSALIFRGASGMLGVNDVPVTKMSTAWLHISSLGGQLAVLQTLLRFAQEKKVKVAFNPGKADIEAMKRETGVVHEMLAGVEVLLTNREEAALLMGTSLEDPVVWQADQELPGVRWWVITDGKEGGKVVSEEKTIWYEVLPVAAVEETGAGDAFGSGLVAALMKDESMETAISWAKKQAASVVSYMGPKRGLLSLDQIK